jgi:hypothetical protein
MVIFFFFVCGSNIRSLLVLGDLYNYRFFFIFYFIIFFLLWYYIKMYFSSKSIILKNFLLFVFIGDLF